MADKVKLRAVSRSDGKIIVIVQVLAEQVEAL